MLVKIRCGGQVVLARMEHLFVSGANAQVNAIGDIKSIPVIAVTRYQIFFEK
jgi:hypothetical protein